MFLEGGGHFFYFRLDFGYTLSELLYIQAQADCNASIVFRHKILLYFLRKIADNTIVNKNVLKEFKTGAILFLPLIILLAVGLTIFPTPEEVSAAKVKLMLSVPNDELIFDGSSLSGERAREEAMRLWNEENPKTVRILNAPFNTTEYSVMVFIIWGIYAVLFIIRRCCIASLAAAEAKKLREPKPTQ
jgi:hypothetical protein